MCREEMVVSEGSRDAGCVNFFYERNSDSVSYICIVFRCEAIVTSSKVIFVSDIVNPGFRFFRKKQYNDDCFLLRMRGRVEGLGVDVYLELIGEGVLNG